MRQPDFASLRSGRESDVLRSTIVRLVGFCTRRPWLVIALGGALALASAVYAATHFAIKTDVNDLFSRSLPWSRDGFAFQKAFPQQNITVVVSAPTPELAEAATGKLSEALAARHDVIRGVLPLDTGDFFTREGFLFLPAAQVGRMAGGLAAAGPVVEALAEDPSLRGSLGALDTGLAATESGQLKLDALAPAMTMAADTAQDLLAGRPAHFSWRDLAEGKPGAGGVTHFIQVDPVLNFHALEPGRAATDAVAATVRQLDLAGAYQAQVRQTGLVPIDDDQFSTIRKNAGLNIAVSLLAVLVILWLALRSWRIILPVALSIAAGLSIAAAFGLLLVGALNLISVAFFVLFVGLGIDFGIQFSVRYRAERHDFGDLHPALLGAARKAGGPLALAAAATAIGFSSFIPTAYRGLGELGEIAGSGMIIAFLSSITLLPALLQILQPPEEARPMGFARLAPVDRFLMRRRMPVLVVTLLAVLCGSPLLLRLSFDFNPLHLHNPDNESVSTFLQLRKDPALGANAIEILAPDLQAADAAGARLAKLPQVAQVRSLDSLVPADQPQKLQAIKMAAGSILPSLKGAQPAPAPTRRQNSEALAATAKLLTQVAAAGNGPGAAAAHRLAPLLAQLAVAPPAVLDAAERAVGAPLQIALADLRQALDPQPVSAATLPAGLARNWVAPDGRARVQALPKGDPDDTAVLRQFSQAVLQVEPHATGPAVLLYEAANTVVHAFIIAAIFALSAIAVLLWITLRRLSDVALTLLPLLLAGVVTLEVCALFGVPLNFANIIALPLLLGVGVAFKIYYIMAWRRGKTALVQSTLTRAVIFSAMTTGTAFGSLWLSSDPGTSSMGQLMALSLLCTMGAAVLFQPALMGPPREAQQPAQLTLWDDDEEWPEAAPARRRRQPQPAPEVVDR